MTKNVTSVTPASPLLEVKHIFEKKDFHHHIPVVENNQLRGIISLQDFLVAVAGSSLEDTEPVYHDKFVKDIMREHPYVIGVDSTLRDACKILANGNIHALVVCENKVVKGIISTTDILNYILMIDSSEEPG
jgi:acetoin utilization protein AcuB